MIDDPADTALSSNTSPITLASSTLPGAHGTQMDAHAPHQRTDMLASDDDAFALQQVT